VLVLTTRRVELEWRHDALLEHVTVDDERRGIELGLSAGSAGTLDVCGTRARAVLFEAGGVSSATTMTAPPVTQSGRLHIATSVDFRAWATGLADDAVDVLAARCIMSTDPQEERVVFEIEGATNSLIICRIVCETLAVKLVSSDSQREISIAPRGN
jgi:hypothetical protein